MTLTVARCLCTKPWLFTLFSITSWHSFIPTLNASQLYIYHRSDTFLCSSTCTMLRLSISFLAIGIGLVVAEDPYKLENTWPHDYPGKPSGGFSPEWQNCKFLHSSRVIIITLTQTSHPQILKSLAHSLMWPSPSHAALQVIFPSTDRDIPTILYSFGLMRRRTGLWLILRALSLGLSGSTADQVLLVLLVLSSRYTRT